MEIKILVETVPNEQMKVFNINKRISDKSISMFEEIYDIESEGEKIGKLGKTLIGRLLHIEGLEKITLNPYSLSITKGKAFDWVELESNIKKVIEFTIPEYIPDKNEVADILNCAEEVLKKNQ